MSFPPNGDLTACYSPSSFQWEGPESFFSHIIKRKRDSGRSRLASGLPPKGDFTRMTVI